MDCHWCSCGLKELEDNVISEKFDQGLANGLDEVFESAMNDLLHKKFHQIRRRGRDRADAMDVVLQMMMRLWRWWKRQRVKKKR